MKNLFFVLFFIPMFSWAGGDVAESKTLDVAAPAAGGQEFFIGALIPTGKVEMGSFSSTYSGLQAEVEYGYGLAPVAALYVDQLYTDFTVSPDTGSSTKISGLGDTRLGVKGILDSGNMYGFYDLAYNAQLGKFKEDKDSGDQTAFSSRPSIQGRVGAGYDFGTVAVGATYQYNSFMDGTFDVVSGGTTSSSKDKAGSGSTYRLTAQVKLPWILGLTYADAIVDSYDTVDAGGGITTTSKSETSQTGLFSIIQIAAGNELQFQVTKLDVKEPSGVTSNLYYLGAAYRVTF